MKLPAFISHAIESNGDFCKITLTKRQLQILIGVVSTLLVLSLALGIWGALRQAELIQLRQQTQLQTEQLKLLQQKTAHNRFEILESFIEYMTEQKSATFCKIKIENIKILILC